MRPTRQFALRIRVRASASVCPITLGTTHFGGVTRLKVAVTVLFRSRRMTESPAPLQAPLHPVKVERRAGASVRVTAVPFLNCAEQPALQSIPAGELVTVPSRSRS